MKTIFLKNLIHANCLIINMILSKGAKQSIL